MTRAKICCISSVDEARLAVRAGAAAVGLVSEMPSGPGVISVEEIAAITVTVPWPVVPVLLTSKTTAVEKVRPWMVDVCSGVRSEDRLDSKKLAAFLAVLRS